jgi:ApbE superfamily uncharacterized protein (UPF0280 family)
VPRFDASTNLKSLVAGSDERTAVQRQIAFTDDLIDRIVYHLYDFTDEEVAIVEDET